MDKKCDICGNELYQDDKNEWFCSTCEAEDFLMAFDKEDDNWMTTKFKVVQPKTKSVTIRLNIFDIEKAKQLAKDKNLPYQTLIKDIIHKNLI